MAIHSHLMLMAMFAALVAVVGAALTKDTPREQIRMGALIFFGLLGSAYALGWLLYIFPLSF